VGDLRVLVEEVDLIDAGDGLGAELLQGSRDLLVVADDDLGGGLVFPKR